MAGGGGGGGAGRGALSAVIYNIVYTIYIQFPFLLVCLFSRFAVRISLLSISSILNDLLIQVFERNQPLKFWNI